MNYVFFYVESNIVCSILLAFILYKDMCGIDRQTYRFMFDFVVALHILYFLLDALCSTYGNILSSSPLLSCILAVCVHIVIAATSYGWYLYSEAIQNACGVGTWKKCFTAAVPAFFVLLLITAGMIAGHKFWINTSSGLPHHAGYCYAVIIIPLAYIIIASCRAFFRAKKKENYLCRREYIQIALYPLVMITFAAFQMIYPKIPLVCFGCTIFMVFMYICSLDALISRDPLTQLNNRNEMNRYLTQMYKTLRDDSHLYLLILDIDGFKQINDEYGHVEGDKALLRVVQSLREACSRCASRHFLARYGGDEFIIVLKAGNISEIHEFCSSVKEILDRKDKEEGCPYVMDVTFGFVEFTRTARSFRENIILADKELYKNKGIKKAAQTANKTEILR